ncbi:MAG: hypothetical protein EZS28_052794, partial [Streblomastix strix]
KRQCLVEAFIATTNTDGLVDLSGDTSKKAEEVYVPFGTQNILGVETRNYPTFRLCSMDMTMLNFVGLAQAGL